MRLLGKLRGEAKKKLKHLDVAKIAGEPVNLVTARMKNADYDRSDLEQICHELACEFEIDG